MHFQLAYHRTFRDFKSLGTEVSGPSLCKVFDAPKRRTNFTQFSFLAFHEPNICYSSDSHEPGLRNQLPTSGTGAFCFP